MTTITETFTETFTEIGTEIATAIDTCMEANADAGTATAADGALDTAEEWLTRPRIGQLAGKNEQTIDRDIKRHGFESRSLPKGSKLFRVSDFIRIGRIKATDIPNELTAGQAVEVLRLQEQVAALLRENCELRGRLEEVRCGRIDARPARREGQSDQGE
ncbi:MAG: hypothetical protein F2840_18360 [Actinobacteria bacterium]|uniref:Unannotated protein n=1 Tax=freshwater metagenome TaxID=449393 RepID=A0A6J7M5P2_9ZZZZ|nr:hypothetical protein [Actinomycetota bacterium]